MAYLYVNGLSGIILKLSTNFRKFNLSAFGDTPFWNLIADMDVIFPAPLYTVPCGLGPMRYLAHRWMRLANANWALRGCKQYFPRISEKSWPAQSVRSRQGPVLHSNCGLGRLIVCIIFDISLHAWLYLKYDPSSDAISYRKGAHVDAIGFPTIALQYQANLGQSVSAWCC